MLLTPGSVVSKFRYTGRNLSIAVLTFLPIDSCGANAEELAHALDNGGFGSLNLKNPLSLGACQQEKTGHEIKDK
jgi:hypothetical protein